MKFQLIENEKIVIHDILANNEKHAWNIVKKMGISNKSKIYKLHGD